MAKRGRGRHSKISSRRNRKHKSEKRRKLSRKRRTKRKLKGGVSSIDKMKAAWQRFNNPFTELTVIKLPERSRTTVTLDGDTPAWAMRKEIILLDRDGALHKDMDTLDIDEWMKKYLHLEVTETFGSLEKIEPTAALMGEMDKYTLTSDPEGAPLSDNDLKSLVSAERRRRPLMSVLGQKLNEKKEGLRKIETELQELGDPKPIYMRRK